MPASDKSSICSANFCPKMQTYTIRLPNTKAKVGDEIRLPWSANVPYAIVRVIGHGHYASHLLVQFVRPA